MSASEITPSSGRSPSGATLPRFAILMAVLIALAAFPQSALFTVDRVEVQGTRRLSSAEVVELSAVRRGERLFATDGEAVMRRLEADPRIKSAAVRLRPPRGVVITITERVPIAAAAIGSRFALVDEEAFAVALADGPGGLPEVVDNSGMHPLERRGVAAVTAGIRSALAALPVIPEQLRADLIRVVVDPGQDLTLVMRSGLSIRAGKALGLPERLGQVPELLATLRGKQVFPAVLDLRYSGSVVITPAGATPSGAGDVR